jgi:hypothetical protein
VASPSFDYWAGLRVQTVPVLYCDFELDEQEHLRRCQELAAGMGLDDVPTHFYYLELAGLPTPEAFALAAQEARRLQAGLVIVDSVGFALDGDSEVAKDVLRFHKEYIGAIREVGATPLLIDHQAKVIKGEKYSDKQEFGSVYKFNAARSSFQIRGAWDGNELTTTFTHKKTNFGPKIQDFSLKLVFRTGRVEVTRLGEAVPNPDKAPSKKERVYAAVEELGLATAETVSNKTNIKLQTVRNAACGGEITKRLLKLARSGTAFTVTRGWRGNERVLRLRQHHDPKPPNGVGGIGNRGSVTYSTNTTYTTNTTNSDGNLSNGVGSGKTALGSRERRERRQ